MDPLKSLHQPIGSLIHDEILRYEHNARRSGTPLADMHPRCGVKNFACCFQSVGGYV